MRSQHVTGALGWLTRLASGVRSRSLDAALVTGADPVRSRRLEVRALTLESPRARASIAAGLEQWIKAAHAPASRRRVLPRHGATLANESELRELADLLRGTSPLTARGIAAIRRLLIDGTGPAYVGDADALARQLDVARDVLRTSR